MSEQNQTALAVINQHQGDLVFVKPEDLQVQKMFIAQVTVLHATSDDFHNISGNHMPKGDLTDRIGSAAGVDFIEAGCNVDRLDDHTWVGRAQGQRRMPDGTWRKSSVCEYEFDAEIRAEEIFLKDKYNKYTLPNGENARKLMLIELKKFGRARAGTGARYKVIRELVGMPIGFRKDQLQKALVIHRISVNTDAMLADPNMRQAALAHATQIEANIFEPEQKQIEATDEVIDVTPDTSDGPDFGSDTAPGITSEPVADLSPVDEAKMVLETYKNNEAVLGYVGQGNQRHPIQAINETIDDPNASLDDVNALIENLKKIPGVE